MTYIVMQQKKDDWFNNNNPEPMGEFKVHPLDRITLKCIFTRYANGRWTERHRVEDFYFKTFDDEESARRFVKESEHAAGVKELREEYEYAKDAMREAGDTYRAALKKAGKIAWDETDEQ